MSTIYCISAFTVFKFMLSWFLNTFFFNSSICTHSPLKNSTIGVFKFTELLYFSYSPGEKSSTLSTEYTS